ncbi:hypothetical protein [Pelotomaculum propionicicum]|uniref:DUF4878 domain-containing protein n=1 Tax=Pelotomaculum propionicicum TaxID=258475 RepID=A0A4Y7RMA7_9FIRM|nr:hypothetical protein [Pelotomaculum propionicicum]TEB10003.1 hypothetical protein Pmgp_02698 [Pelotomaculum propionicicum]
MFKTVLSAVILTFFCLIIPVEPALKPAHFSKETEVAIVHLVREAVEDTAWLRASSRAEMELILKRFYTGQLLQEISDKAWDFVKIPNSWDYVVKAGKFKIDYVSNDTAAVSVEVVETDEITGISYYTQLEYMLLKTDTGWKITARKVLSV